MVKKFVSILLVLCMVLSLPISALAAEITPTTDKTSIKAGEDVELTITMAQKLEGVQTFSYRIYFDTALYEYKSKVDGAVSVAVSDLKTDEKDSTKKYITASVIDSTSNGLTLDGLYCKLTFTAKEDVSETTESTFTLISDTWVDSQWQIHSSEESTDVTVIVAPKPKEIKATVSVQGNNRNSAFADLSDVTYTCTDADEKTALDAVTSVLTNNGYTYEGTTYISSITSQDSIKLFGGDTAYGPWSGWVYKINGEEAAVGMGDYKLADGDVITVYYIACYTATGDHTFDATGKCTVCSLQREAGYFLTMADDTTAKAGDSVAVGVTVGYTSDAVTSFNAVDLTFTYDSSKLEFVSVSDTTNYTVSTTDGTVHVLGYGEAKNFGQAFALNFKVLAATGTEGTLVKATSAKIDKSENAVSADAPEALLVKVSTKITVPVEHSVTLPEIFTGDDTVADGADYTFQAADADHYTYSNVTATMGSETVTVKDNADGSYTIEKVTGDVVVSGKRAGVEYPVTLSGNAASEINYATTATYGTGYTFMATNLDPATYDYTMTMTVDGKSYTPAVKWKTYSTMTTCRYTISAEDVVGPINAVFTKTEKAAATTQIVFSGEGASDVVNGTTQTATTGADFTFSLTKDSSYDYTVKLNGETLTPGTDGKYIIPGASISGTALTVTVEKSVSSRIVDVQKYVNLDGTSMWLVSVAGTAGEGKAFTYDGQPMYASSKYAEGGSSVYLVIAESLTKADAAKKVAVATGTAAGTVDYTGDVNGSKTIDINDAQLVYDLYNARYADFTGVTMYKFLCADVSDSVPEGATLLNVSDAVAIVNIIK